MAQTFIDVVIENLASLIKAEVGLIMGVDKEMKQISNTLTTIRTVLEDAEDKLSKRNAIQNWLSKLNETAFEIEDLLDECVAEVSKLKGSSRFEFAKKIQYNHKIGRRMKEVAEKLDAIAADRHNLHLCERQFVAREMGSVVNALQMKGEIAAK